MTRGIAASRRIVADRRRDADRHPELLIGLVWEAQAAAPIHKPRVLARERGGSDGHFAAGLRRSDAG